MGVFDVYKRILWGMWEGFYDDSVEHAWTSIGFHDELRQEFSKESNFRLSQRDCKWVGYIYIYIYIYKWLLLFCMRLSSSQETHHGTFWHLMAFLVN